MKLLGAIWLASVSVPALADTTAVYDFGYGLATMRIEVADSGAARITHQATAPGAPAQFGYFTPDGRSYMAWQQDGRWVVADFDDVTAIMAEGFAAWGTEKHPAGSFHWMEKGRESDGGRAGTLWVLAKPDGSDTGFELVMSEDADLAPVGRLFAKSWQNSMNGMTRMMGSTPEMFADLPALLAKGTLIRMGRITVLSKVDHSPIDPSSLKLPAAPLSRDEVRRIMVHPAPPPAQ